MTALPTVSVDDNFTAGQAAVAHGAADHETTRGINKITCVTVDEFFGENFFNHLFDNGFPQIIIRDIRLVLAGDDHRIHPQRRRRSHTLWLPGICRPAAENPMPRFFGPGPAAWSSCGRT